MKEEAVQRFCSLFFPLRTADPEYAEEHISRAGRLQTFPEVHVLPGSIKIRPIKQKAAVCRDRRGVKGSAACI